MIEYGSEVLAMRSRKRIAQAELAKSIGIHTATLIDIENGRVGIDESTYNRILSAIDQIISESGSAN